MSEIKKDLKMLNRGILPDSLNFSKQNNDPLDISKYNIMRFIDPMIIMILNFQKNGIQKRFRPMIQLLKK